MTEPMHTVAAQNQAATELARDLRRLKLDAARASLPTERIVQVLTDLLTEEQRLFDEERANARSYG